MKFINMDHYEKYGTDSKIDQLVEEEIKQSEIYFQSIKNSFSKTFIEKYFKYHGFHDWDVINIENNVRTYEKTKKIFVVTVHERFDNITKKIVYTGVRALNIDFNERHFQQWSHDNYVIDEFLKLEDSYLSHEVYFPSGSSYYVEFKKIRIE